MRNSSPAPGTAAQSSSNDGAALGPSPEATPVTGNPLPGRRPDTPAEAEGRRTLSTAYVRVGPDGYLTVTRRDGRVLVLRNAVLRPRDYCGTLVSDGKAGSQYCGGYAEIAAAGAGGGPLL